MKVCLVIAPFQNPTDARARIKEFLRWLSPLVDEVSIVTANFPDKTIIGDKLRIVSVRHNSRKQGALVQAIKQILLQLNISLHLIKPALDSQVVIFWISGTFALPMLLTKLLRRKLLLFVTGSWLEAVKYNYRKETYGIIGTIFYHSVRILEKTSYILADKIILLSPALGEQIRRIAGNGYLSKCHIGVARPIDTNLFLVNKPLKERRLLVGYIGRFSEEKGLTNLVKAFSLLLQRQDGLRFIFIGGGPLIEDIKKRVMAEGLAEKVTFTGWVPARDVADCLNQMRLLILPSYSEGLPVVILEAMACGTPVLATPVGGVPDIIKDGETGFIMEDNSPECIVRNVIRALNHPNLEEISRNAHALVKKEFTYEVMVERYGAILASME